MNSEVNIHLQFCKYFENIDVFWFIFIMEWYFYNDIYLGS